MKWVFKSLLFIIPLFTLTQCAQQQAYEKLPELINEDTGLREFRFRSADCIDTVYQHISSNCDHKQQIVTEKSPNSDKEIVLIRELTPNLKEKFKTVVSPTVQYDEKNGKIYVSATLRINENSDRDFTEFKYTFEGDLKGFREKYKTDKSLRYIPLEKKSGPTEKLNGVVYCATQPSCDEVALVFSFLNPGPDGKELVDSKTFTIDGRESAKTPTDTQPGKAEQRTLEIKITEVEFPDEFGVDDIADPENHEVFANVKAPVLPKDPTGALCAGMVSDPTQCPDYIYDSTQKNPLHEEESEDEDDALVDVFNMDQDILGQPQTPEQTDTDKVTTDGNATQPVVPPTGQADKDQPKTDIGNGAVSDNSAVPTPNEDGDKKGGFVITGPDDQNSSGGFVITGPDNDTGAVSTTTPPATSTTTPVENTNDNEVKLPTENIPIPTPRPDYTPPTADNNTETPKETPKSPTPAEILAEIPIDQIPRPMPRPDHLGQGNASPAVAGKNQLLSVDGKFIFDLTKCTTQLNRLQTGVFNQSRGIYYGGSLRNGKQYSKGFESNRPNTSKKSRQFSSDLTLLTVEYAACVLEQKYKNIKIDIHDFSLQNGGKIGGHGSHQNGLDVDLSYPHIGNKTKGFDKFVNNMTDERTEVALDYAKILYSTDRIHIIFTDTKIKKRFCQYMKNKGRLTNEYKNFINNNLRHIAGHGNHYHIRMKCNSQNEFCQPQGKLTTEKVCQ